MYNKLTIVLVTQPSRISYLPQSFASIDHAMMTYTGLHLLVIFNGRSEEGMAALEDLKVKFAERVRAEIVPENQSVPNDVIRIMRSHNLEWVHMPGDDDVIIPGGYEEFFNESQDYSSFVAIAHTALCQEENGALTGKTLKPFLRDTHSIGQKLARSLHRPPFVWPSLIFNFSKLPDSVYRSRFVFDWWVGLTLIQIGEIRICNQPLVRYRIHPSQESMRVRERRKRFEAELMIQSNLIRNIDIFTERIHGDLTSFLQEIESFPPVFGDPEFGASTYLLMKDYFGGSDKSLPKVSESYLAEFSALKNVVLLMCEFPGVNPGLMDQFHGLNVAFDVGVGVCTETRELLRRVNISSSRPSFTIHCMHSIQADWMNHEHVVLDCSLIGRIHAEHLMSQLVSDIEVLGVRSRKHVDLSNWELRVIHFLRWLLAKVRKVRSFLPR